MKTNTIAASKFTLGISLVGLAIFALPGYAQVAPGIQITDGSNNIVTVNSLGVVSFGGSCSPTSCTTTSIAGSMNGSVVSWSGVIGNFNLTAVGNVSGGNPDIALTGSTTSTAVGGTLNVLFTVTGVDAALNADTLVESTNWTTGGGSATYTGYEDLADNPYAISGATVTNLGTLTDTSLVPYILNAIGPASHDLSLTDQAILKVNPGSSFSTDFFIATTPNTPLTLSSCPSGSGMAGIAYPSSSLGSLASGGVLPYSFSIAGGPPGLSISNGILSGTPTAQGTFNAILTVKDSSGLLGLLGAETATQNCPFTISPPSTPMSLKCPGVTTGEIGIPYSSTLIAGGGTGSGYMWTVTSGSLNGLTLYPTSGALSGTPTASGTITFTAQVTDNGDSTEPPASSGSCSIAIAPPPSMTCSAVNSGTIGTAWPANNAPTVTGGTLPYTFSYKVPIGGNFPAGLTLNTSTGALTGTPTSSGTFAIFVTDADGVSATSNCTINVPNAITIPPTLSLACPLGTATVGTMYTSAAAATGGVPPYIYALAAGSLPSGLTLNTSTGVISGTPTGAGTSGFTIKVTDSAGKVATSSCTGTCATATASINFNSPTGNLTTSHVYTVSGTTVTAYGYTNSGAATGLDGQNNSGVQNDGLGISSTSNGQIDTNNFVQLDFTKALAAGATNGQISISGLNQCQNGESYAIYGSNTAGSIGVQLGNIGTTDSTLFAIPSFGTYKYISVRAHSGNVLIAQISFSLPGTTCSITVAPAPAPKISIKKTANVSKVNPFQPVTFTYVVTNTGAFTLTNVTVTDDNATPSYTGDDFTAGTIASLAPGASVTFTHTSIPPVSEGGTQQSWNGWGNSYSGWDNNGWGGNNTTTAGTLICSQLSNGNYQIIYRQDPSQTDNTYGRGSSSSWAGQQRNFSDMLSGQAAEFRFLDAKGNTVLDVATDYISKSSKFPSGYGTLGIGGGNGAVISGSGSHVVSCDTTLSHNINQSSSFYQCTQNSSSSSSWDNVSGYTIVVDGKTFGSAGWGGVAIPDCHNQNSIQQGCNDQKVSPISSASTNTATVTAYDGSIEVSATATATVQIDASQSGWSQCSKY